MELALGTQGHTAQRGSIWLVYAYIFLPNHAIIRYGGIIVVIRSPDSDDVALSRVQMLSNQVMIVDM